MTLELFPLKTKYLLATVFLSCAFISSSSLLANAEDKTTTVASNFEITFEPPNENQPQTTKAGASRGNQCNLDSQEIARPFAPLIPASNYGLTVASHPTLLAYIPETSAEYVFFTVQDENEEETYQAILPIGNKSGIVSLDMPQEAPALKIGKTYKWSFALMCDNQLKPDSPVIEGFIKRIQPESELIAQLQETESLEIAALYGKAGIWYETVSTLARLKEAEPENTELPVVWNNLLSDVGLESIANLENID